MSTYQFPTTHTSEINYHDCCLIRERSGAHAYIHDTPITQTVLGSLGVCPSPVTLHAHAHAHVHAHASVPAHTCTCASSIVLSETFHPTTSRQLLTDPSSDCHD